MQANSSIDDGHAATGTTADSLLRLAADEVRINRAALEKLYALAGEVSGDVRYELLWRVSELERACRELDWLQRDAHLDRHSLRRRISAAVRDAVMQRREARRLVLAAWQERQSITRTGRSTRTRAVPAGSFTPTARPAWATQ
jgi:hypothetical protein